MLQKTDKNYKRFAGDQPVGLRHSGYVIQVESLKKVSPFVCRFNLFEFFLKYEKCRLYNKIIIFCNYYKYSDAKAKSNFKKRIVAPFIIEL